MATAQDAAADKTLDRLLRDIRACRICATALPLGPRPVVRASRSARLMIIGQAPGTRVHETGIPWNDPSGERLRDWLQLEPARFYDESLVAIVPMGFCYPGVDKNGGDKPPRRECAPEWHPRLAPFLGGVGLTLLVGSYAQAHYLGFPARADDDGDGAPMARLSAGISPAAASELAQHGVAEAQSVVRGRGFARIAAARDPVDGDLTAAASAFGFDCLHLRIREAIVMADLVHQDMMDQVVQVLSRVLSVAQ